MKKNIGIYNVGNFNIGDYNAGNYNTGDYNAGNWNTGDYNAGHCNVGNCNAGDYNVGNYNAGHWNVGDWNKASFTTGCFMTEEQKIMLFNKPSEWTYHEWIISDARRYLSEIPKNVVEWVCSSDMTDTEKETHPEYKTTKGYLRILDETESAQAWWDGLPEHKRQVIKSLPNFDGAIFEECTGIKTD